MYPDLVYVFYSNLSFRENIIHSHVKNIDIDISLEGFTTILHLSCEGVDVFHFDFNVKNIETTLIASWLLHDDDNPGLVKNEKVKYYTLITQVLAKIVFFNLIPKLGKYSHARSYAPLLIYSVLKGIRVNIPKLLIDFMLSEYLMIPSRNFSYGMIISHLLKFFKIDVSGENACPLSLILIAPFWRGCMPILAHKLSPL